MPHRSAKFRGACEGCNWPVVVNSVMRDLQLGIYDVLRSVVVLRLQVFAAALHPGEGMDS
jgi:hypothetical protein